MCGVYDDTAQTISLYKDGSLVDGPTSHTYGVCDVNRLFEIGARNQSGGHTDGHHGAIDDVRLYDRALSASEIKRLYGCTSPAYVEGSLHYNPSWTVMQYCNGINWVGIGKPVPATADCPNIGDVCADGSVYAGVYDYGSGNEKIYTTPADAGSLQQWSVESVDTGADSTSDGQANQAWIVGNETLSNYPAFNYCENLTDHVHRDWYLPAKNELNVLYTNNSAIGGFDTSGSYTSGYYWSSTENNSNNAWWQKFSIGSQNDVSKALSMSFRCVQRH